MIPEFPRSELTDRVGELLHVSAPVVLAPITSDIEWAATTAWEVARALAATREVALIDLFVDDGPLSKAADVVPAEGITDALEYGASAARVQAVQSTPNLRFTPAGTFISESADLWGHPRWNQVLHAFAADGRSVILFAPGECVAHLAVDVAGIVLLSPAGVWDEARLDPILTAADGPPVLGVVTATMPTDLSDPGPPQSRRIRFELAVPAVALGLAIAALTLWPAGDDPPIAADPPEPAAESRAPDAPPTPSEVTVTDSGPRPATAAPVELPPPPPSPLQPALVPAPFGVQVASLADLRRAAVVLAEMESGGFITAITPVRVSDGGLWYRVIVGAESDSSSALAVRNRLVQLGLPGSEGGFVSRFPYTFQLEGFAANDETVSGLRERGIPAYILPAVDGTPTVVLGAFRRRRAPTADSILAAANISATIRERLGNSP